MAEFGVIEITDERYPRALKEALSKLTPSLGPKKLYYKGAWNSALFENCLAEWVIVAECMRYVSENSIGR